jgi:APA family basic amino acid/polyamine antiporter
MFGRVKSLDAILATAKKNSLHRSLGAFQLTMMGIGGIIGTGIFVLTAEAATKAGPAMMWSFVLAAVVCGLTALCYAEMAAMIPVSGSAYTYAYSTFGELLAWTVGWALVLEYAIAASAVSVGWSGYMVGLFRDLWGIGIGNTWTHGPLDPEPGLFNVPAFIIAIVTAALLYRGTTESARVNAVLVCVKIAALTLFIALAWPAINGANFHPFNPYGFMKHEVADPASGHMVAVGIAAAASSIFFAYVGFDAVSTAAEETKNPNRNIPIGLLGSLAICTVFYLLVAAGAIGSIGAQPGGELATSHDALAYVMRAINHPLASKLLQIAAGVALPSVVLMMMFGQTRIAFVMARDGLLPAPLAKVHPEYKTPYVITMVTGVFVALFAAVFPVGQLADISNSGTLFAFTAVTLGVMMLRVRDPGRYRPFRTPLLWVVAPLATVGCVFLFFQLSFYTLKLFVAWAVIGLVVYALYSRKRSHVGLGLVEVHELDADVPPQPVAPLPGGIKLD